MSKIGIITGTTRPNRKSLDVGRWVLETAQKRGDAQYELVDIQDFDLPLFDEPAPPILGQYQRLHTKRWAERVASLDARRCAPANGSKGRHPMRGFLLHEERQDRAIRLLPRGEHHAEASRRAA